MNLLNKLQTRLLEKDILKGKSSDYLAKNYPMSMLWEVGVFERFANTELFVAKASRKLYDIKGNSLGELVSENVNGKYIIVAGWAEFKNTDAETSYAVYDREGKCVVPHGCYMNAYVANDYLILTMPMDEPYIQRRPERIVKTEDGGTIMESDGKNLGDTLGGSVVSPRALIVTNDEIIQTKYMSICPAPISSYCSPFDNDIVWIAQTENKKEVALKFDKRMYLTETYELPYMSHTVSDLFYEEEGTNHVYKIDTQKMVRINLRTGQVVNLLNLKKSRLSKKERLAEAKANEVLTENIESEVEEVETQEDLSV